MKSIVVLFLIMLFVIPTYPQDYAQLLACREARVEFEKLTDEFKEKQAQIPNDINQRMSEGLRGEILALQEELRVASIREAETCEVTSAR